MKNLTFTFSIELFTFRSSSSTKHKTRFSRKENLKKCTSTEEHKGARYIRGNVYFDFITTVSQFSFGLLYFREMKGVYQIS